MKRLALDQPCPVICGTGISYEHTPGSGTAPDLLDVERFRAKKARDITRPDKDAPLDFGDQFLSARTVVDAWWREDMVQEVADAANYANDGKPPKEVTLLMPQRSGDRVNSLTATFALRLKHRLEAHYDGQVKVTIKNATIKGSSARDRAEASAIERLATIYTMELDPTVTEGNVVVFVDDHLQNGSNFMSTYSEAKKRGVNIAAVAVLTANPNCRSLTMEPQVQEALLQVAGCELPALDRVLDQVGLSHNTLTNREGLTLFTLMSNGADDAHAEIFSRIAQPEDVRGMDSLTALFKRAGREPLTLAALNAQLGELHTEHQALEGATSPLFVKALPTDTVFRS